MYRIRSIFISILFLGITVIPTYAAGLPQSTVLEKDTTIQEIPLTAGTEVFLDEAGKLMGVVPVNEMTIKGMSALGKTVVGFHENGNVANITLAKDTSVQGVEYKTKTILFLKEDGAVEESILPLETDTNVRGVTIKAGNWVMDGDTAYVPVTVAFAVETKIQDIQFQPGDYATLGENGEIMAAIVVNDITIQGIRARRYTGVTFHDNGKIQSVTLAQDTAIQDLFFKAGTEIELDSDGKLIAATLSQDTIIQGVKAKGGTKITFDNQILHTFTLAEDSEIQGLTFAAGTKITFAFSNLSDPDKAELEQSAAKQKIELARLGGDLKFNELQFKAGDNIFFSHPGNNVSYISYAEIFSGSIEIKGIKIIPGNGISFYDSGSIESITLAEGQDVKLQGLRIGMDLKFYENGKLKSAVLAKDARIKGKRFTAGTRLTLYESGNLSSVKLKNNRVFQGIKFRGGTEISFYENGKVISGKLAADTTIQGKKVLAEQDILKMVDIDVIFYDTGKLQNAVLAVDQTIQKIRLRAKTRIELYENGKLKTVTVTEDTRIKGKKIKAGTYVRFDEKGNITYMQPPIQAENTNLLNGDSIPPSDVENLKATLGNSEVTLTWDSASDDVGVTGYKIYVGTHSVTTPYDAYDLPVISVGNINSYTVTDLTSGKPYYFSVTAVDAAGNESLNYAIEAQAIPK